MARIGRYDAQWEQDQRHTRTLQRQMMRGQHTSGAQIIRRPKEFCLQTVRDIRSGATKAKSDVNLRL